MTLHIAASHPVGLAVRRGIRQAVCFIADGWLVGPSASDLEVHKRIRADYWDYPRSQRAKFLASFRRVLSALDADEPVVLWTSPAWNDRVALWALCSYRLQRWPAQPDLSVVVVGQCEQRPTHVSFGIANVTLEPALARDALGTARPLSLSEVRAKSLLWKKLAAPSPVLSEKPLRETRAIKELVELGAYQAGLFPRQTARGLSLSTLDALLLACIDEAGSMPGEIFMCESEKGEELRRWFELTGDVILLNRLVQWATHEPAALKADLGKQPHPWRARYALSVTGHAILRDGLSSISQAPPLPIWGATAYDPNNPWVVVDEHAGRPRLERFEARPHHDG